MKSFDLSNVVSLLNQLLEMRLMDVTRYTHYALMVSGTERITMANFFTAQASESLRQAQAIGQLLIALNERPSFSTQSYQEPQGQSLHEMLLRSLHGERQAAQMYQELKGDRSATSHCFQELAQSMLTCTSTSTNQLVLMLQAREQPMRAAATRN